MKIQTIAFTKIQLAFSLYFCQFFDPFQHGVVVRDTKGKYLQSQGA